MNKEDIFAVWAPDDSRWGRWVKPVLFAVLEPYGRPTPPPIEWTPASWAPELSENVAIVVDLPGAQSVAVGIALANAGYRPVPLFNALPLPAGLSPIDSITNRPVAMVDVQPVIQALQSGAETLATLNIPADAPPVFLLDAKRSGGIYQPRPDEFDNRSICFTTDFPSANFLAAHGIARVVLVQQTESLVAADLAQVLRRWQDNGMRLGRVRLDFPGPPEPMQVRRPAWYGVMFQRVLARMGFHRAQAGGFGAWVMDSSAGG